MRTTFIGREKEQGVLQKALDSKEAEMVSVIGRRRIGKTFLIKTYYQEHIVFELTGTKNAPLNEQLQNFSYALQLSAENLLLAKAPENWMEAFFMLINYLKTLPKDKKQVVFFDELPWLSTHKSGFLRALSFFWNSWAVNQNLVLVICGSAASWMIRKVVNDTGGLHNRITRRIHLQPFTLAETEQYLQARNIRLKRYHILQLYMTMGGIPHYLKEVEAGRSATQNIEAICFSDTALLRDEFSNLYPALFENADNHIAVIRALSKKRKGLDRKELIETAKVPNGGSLTRLLEDLEQSGFIDVYFPFGKKNKQKLYRLTDEYSLFYLQFIEGHRKERAKTWQHISQTQQYKIWAGYAFESICIKHLTQIKKALSIAGVHSVASSFVKKGTKTEKGTQIDLLLDRNDHIITIFEIKFYIKSFTITKSYAQNLEEKLHIFEETTKTRKQVFLNMITTFGIVPNEHSLGLVEQVLTLDDLFA